GAAHVVPFRVVVVEQMAGQVVPEAGERMAGAGERAGQQGRRGTRKDQNGPTHDFIPSTIRALLPASSFGRPAGRRGSCLGIMARQRLKTGQREVLSGRKIRNQPFSFLIPPPEGGGWRAK